VDNVLDTGRNAMWIHPSGMGEGALPGRASMGELQ